MRWTIHIPFRPLPWRGLLYATAHRAPATTDSGACLCSCRRGALCVTHLRLRFDSMGDEEGYVYIFTNELAVAACAKDRRSLSTRPRAPPEKETVSNATRDTRSRAGRSHTNRGAKPRAPEPARASTPIGCSTM